MANLTLHKFVVQKWNGLHWAKVTDVYASHVGHVHDTVNGYAKANPCVAFRGVDKHNEVIVPIVCYGEVERVKVPAPRH